MLYSIVPPKILGVIPARFASTRFPGKPLAVIAGKPMIEHVWQRAGQARLINRLLIATDDERIRAAARSFGADVAMTRADHVSGTDRVAEAAAATDAEVVVNIQGDEPLIDPVSIDLAIQTLLDDAGCQLATLKKRLTRPEDIQNPNVVKVVTTHDGRALYFSRSPIPYNRGGGAVYFKHIGLYVYRRELLLNYSALAAGVLEDVEKLEQLRALENGISIRVAETDYETIGVDTPADLASILPFFTDSLSTNAKHG